MQTIFLATEADEGMGHTAPWRDFVRLALSKGHQVHMAAPDVGLLERVLGSDVGGNLWQAPRLRRNVNAAYANPKSWPELLLHLGYGDAAQLTGMVKAWVNVLSSSGASFVIGDYAPGIQLAAQVLGLPVIEAGGGFCVPPLSPVRRFPGVSEQDPAVAKQAEASLCSAFNAVLQKLGSLESLRSMADLATWPSHRVVLSPPQLDHYGARSDVSYLGLLGLRPSSADIDAPHRAEDAATKARVIGYLKPGTPGLPALVDQLAEAGVSVQLYIPGADASLGRGALVVSGQPHDLSQALAQADIYLSNGGLSGVGQALQYGCWPVVVPMQAEQVAMARNLVALQLGAVWLTGVSTAQQVRQMFSARRSTAHMSQTSTSAEATLLGLIDALPFSGKLSPSAAPLSSQPQRDTFGEQYARPN